MLPLSIPISSDPSSQLLNNGSPSLNTASPLTGSLISSPVESPSNTRFETKVDTRDPHTYRPAARGDSRSPCPALNTLANHGYLPHNGRNITLHTLIEALQHPDTYNLSAPLAHFLARGGQALVDHTELRESLSHGESLISSLHGITMKDDSTFDLHTLARHGAVEHNASIVHKNAAKGNPFAPTRTDTVLLDGLLQDRKMLTLQHIARRRVEIECVSKISPFYAEVARGEWALVLDVFGHAHGGDIPADGLRAWLQENRFPDGWRPDHSQGLLETTATSTKLRNEMDQLKKMHVGEDATESEKLRSALLTKPAQDEKVY